MVSNALTEGLNTVSKFKYKRTGIGIGCCLCLWWGVASADNLDQAKSVSSKSIQHSAGSQKKIDNYDAEEQRHFQKYKSVVLDTEQVEAYNKQLVGLTQDQNELIEQLKGEIKAVSTMEADVMPLMEKMIQSLDAFVELDTPFLKQERVERVKKLKEVMSRSDVTISEKFRRILEAYQIEIEYGRTIESYQAKLIGNGSDTSNDIMVEYFRLGRTGLYYLTLDEKSAAVWNKNLKQWESLDSQSIKQLKQAVRVARQETAPSLLQLPISVLK